MVEQFREELRSWLATAPRPEGLRDYGPTPTVEDEAAGRAWQRQLADADWACLNWPKPYGRGASVGECAAFAEEMAMAGVPRQVSIMGPDLVGPILLRFGTDAQRKDWLEPIRTGEQLWCQLFSEPEAGSDLASVRTTAKPAEDGGWIIDGQKVWTSAGLFADWGILLARTGEGRSGLTMFAMPMGLAGVEVRPLRQMDGESKFNEVFLSSVRLEADAVIGEVGQGWTVATATLGQERLSLGSNAVSLFRWWDDLVKTAQESGRLDPVLRQELAKAWTRIWLLRATWQRALDSGEDATFSVLKLLSSTTQKELGELGLSALGPELVAGDQDSDLVHRLLIGPAQTLLGGTSEIQRNILAERILGMPRS